MSFGEPNDPRSREIVNIQIRLTYLARSPSKRSTLVDPGPPLTPQSHARARPDWSVSSEEGSLEKIGRSKEASHLCHHDHPHCVTKARRVFQPSLTDANNTLSSSSGSEGRYSDRHLTDTKMPSMDSGIDSAPCTSSAQPAVAGATLVLSDIQRVKWTISAGHMTNLSETCSLSCDCHGSTSWSEGRSKSSSSTSSPEALITCKEGSTKETGLTQEGEGLKRSSRCSRLSCVPIKDVGVKQSDVTAGEQPIRVPGVPPPSTWRSLTHTMSRDMLYGILFCCSQLPSDHLPPRLNSTLPPTIGRKLPLPLQRSNRSYSDSLLALRSGDKHMSLPQASSQLDWFHLESTQAFKADINQTQPTLGVTSQSSALEDSDITARSLSGEVLRLEEILQQLQLDLLKEQRDKAALQQQVLSLRQENHRLQMESHTAAKHIRRFATWMLRQDSLP